MSCCSAKRLGLSSDAVAAELARLRAAGTSPEASPPQPTSSVGLVAGALTLAALIWGIS